MNDFPQRMLQKEMFQLNKQSNTNFSENTVISTKTQSIVCNVQQFFNFKPTSVKRLIKKFFGRWLQRCNILIDIAFQSYLKIISI